MKTERITLLGSIEFKSFLNSQADKEKISVSEFVRRRCTWAPSDDEILLTAMAEELHQAVGEARSSLGEGLAAIREALDEVQHHAKKEMA